MKLFKLTGLGGNYPNHRWSRAVACLTDKFLKELWKQRKCETCKQRFDDADRVHVLEIRYNIFRGDDDRYFFHENCQCNLENIGWEVSPYKRIPFKPYKREK